MDNKMRKVYLVYYHGNFDDGHGFGSYDCKYIEKAFQTRHEADEYIDSKEHSFSYSIESVNIEPKKEKTLDKK